MILNFQKIKKKLVLALGKLWQNLSLILILLLILDLILGGIFFWRYYLTLQLTKLPPLLPLKINPFLLKQVSSQWEKRDSLFQEILQKEYSDPFRGYPSGQTKD